MSRKMAGLGALLALLGCGHGKKPGKDVTVGASVRACEILLEDKDQPIEAVVFGPQVKGNMQRWAPKTSVAFTALVDAPITTPVLTVQSSSAPSFTVVTTNCYDHEGKPVASPDVKL